MYPCFAIRLLGSTPPYHFVPQLGLLAEGERIHHHDYFAAPRLEKLNTCGRSTRQRTEVDQNHGATPNRQPQRIPRNQESSK